jgi:hypothetical protein
MGQRLEGWLVNPILAWCVVLAQVIVLLYDSATLPLPRSRLFFLDARKGMWFGNEHGHQAWLLESRVSAPGVRGFVDKLGAKAFQAAT